MNYCLEAFRPHLDSRLVSADTFCLIDAFAKSLPPFSAAFLECRLGACEPQVDFAVRVSAESAANSFPKVSAERKWKIRLDAYHDWLTQHFLPAPGIWTRCTRIRHSGGFFADFGARGFFVPT
jgi:hypothetical protein